MRDQNIVIEKNENRLQTVTVSEMSLCLSTFKVEHHKHSKVVNQSDDYFCYQKNFST